ncbi:MAG: DNA-processing protein DprA [Bacteroidales bacterium]|nr:DNA-processing protein DprA [Bacteroidales bacterium]MBN2699698.1 DNA-processing protein DprA [Bacteroidales bacterium]
MSHSELIYRIALTMLQDIGAITAKKLIAYTGSAEAVFSEKRSNLLKIPGIGNHLAGVISSRQNMAEAEKEVVFIQKNKLDVLYFLDDNYPERLKNCLDGPVLLYMKGINCLSSAKILSVVGTRQASERGKLICRELIQNLGARYKDLVIVSGLAYGIDIAAHKAALEYDLKTVAVLGHGLRTLYPSAHRTYAGRIISHGALLTDFCSETKPERNNFIRRNRIIAGLSDGTLIVESGCRGGALITADIAFSYNREVLAVPGRPSDTYSKGCNNMIKKNRAALVECSDDIEYAMNWESNDPENHALQIQLQAFSDDERKIVEALYNNPRLIPETISTRTNIPIHRVLSLLIEMELRDWLTPQPGNTYLLKVKPLLEP